MNRTTSLKRLAAVGAVAAALIPAFIVSGQSLTAAPAQQSSSRYLPKSKLTIQSAKLVDLNRNLVALPLHKGNLRGTPVWFIITDASDFGLAHDLDVNYAPKLANMAIGCPECVQEVTLSVPPGNKFDEAVVNFVGAPDFSPMRVLTAGPTGFPPAAAQPVAVCDAHYSPFIRIAGSSVV